MKKIIFLFISAYLITGCKQEKNFNVKELPAHVACNDRKKAIETIKDFYATFYNDELGEKKGMNKYVSKRILDRIDSLTSDGTNLILDYDPFINGQDYSGSVIKKTIEVKPLDKQNEYRVSFLLFDTKSDKRINIDYELKKDKNGNFLIYTILNDEYLNFRTKIVIKKNDITESLKENISTPNNIIDNLVFTRDNKGNLEINTEILDYISKNTTRENNSYLLALEDYGYKNRNNKFWTINEMSKIKAYIFNTSYPLRKKYWSDKYEEWYSGKPENYLGDRGAWEKNNYYRLPHLREYVLDFMTIHEWER